MLSTRLSILLSAYLFSSAALAQEPPIMPAKPATPPAPAASAPLTREQIPALVKEALLNDPEIITEAMQKLREKQEHEAKKQAKEAIVKYKDELYNDINSPSVGDVQTADVTVVEFFDYHCGYCKQVLPAITQLIKEDKKVRVVFKEYPILSEDSVLASRAALAVSRIAKDKYFDFHTAMFTSKGKFDEKTVMEAAKKLGIDTAKLKSELAKPEVSAALDKNRDVGEALGIRGTPAIIIGDEFFPGAMPYEEIKKAVDAARSAKKAQEVKQPEAKAAAPVVVAPAPAAPTPPAAPTAPAVVAPAAPVADAPPPSAMPAAPAAPIPPAPPAP